MPHLLVTNDFPPKVGGIQNYLWELWRRLPAEDVTVLTRPHPGAAAFDREQPFRIVRTRQPLLLPEPWLGRQINELAAAHGVDLVLYDPVFPVGALAPRLGHRYGVVLHGAEVTVPGRLPATRAVVGDVLRHAALVVTAGDYSTAEAERAAGCRLPVAVVPPGVDLERFVPLDPQARHAARRRFGLAPDGLVVLAVSRLVPRKGFDVVIDAVAALTPRRPELCLVVVGSGRDGPRLRRRAARSGAAVKFLGRVADDELPDLFGAADVFAMLCRSRWGGLEQEGFGIVFLEAAAAGLPQIAGRSGGSADAVAHGVSGLVVDSPSDAAAVTAALAALADDPTWRRSLGAAARQRAARHFDYDLLAERLHTVITLAIAGDPLDGFACSPAVAAAGG
jgi:phosphatidylinositol alpha-1,6-mannosyltransferase